MTKLEHSCKVPKLYKVASKILELVKEKGASLKELVFDNSENKRLHHPNTKGLYALVVASIQNGTVLDQLIRKSQILIKEPKLDPWLARILIVELLWGKKKLPTSNAKPITTVLSYQPTFLGILREAVNSGTHENKPRRNEAALKPRYIRVNTLLLSVGAAINAFRNEGWRQATYPTDDYAAFLRKLSTLAEDEFVQDFHVTVLFAFPPRTEFHQHELYRSGSIALQDKATCLPPYLLNPEPGSAVLDMCAAPGMKTTQLAAIMKNTGTLYAVERHLPRYRTLCQMVPHLGVKCVTTINADATTITPLECRKVKYILVDPTCSGSGMVRPTSAEDEDMDKGRLQKLSEFQAIILERALTNFPSVQRVVYSTCSIYPEENEVVVEKVLAAVNGDRNGPRFRLAEDALQSWPNRGSSNYEVGPKCIVTNPDKDLTTGCFIAVFERVGSPQEEEASSEGEEKQTKKGRKDKKKKSLTSLTMEGKVNLTSSTADSGDETSVVRKRKKYAENENKLENTDWPSNNDTGKKKIKKKRKKEVEEVNDLTMENDTGNKGTKKKKKKTNSSTKMEDNSEDHVRSLKSVKKKRKISA